MYGYKIWFDISQHQNYLIKIAQQSFLELEMSFVGKRVYLLLLNKITDECKSKA